MSPQLLLIVLIALGYVAARLLVRWLAQRFLVVSGAEYLLLGLVLGPSGVGVLPRDTVEALVPVVMLALGVTGARVGSQLYLPMLVRADPTALRLAVGQWIIAFAVVATGMYEWALEWRQLPPRQALFVSVVAGALAAASARAGIEALAAHGRQAAAGVRPLQLAATADGVLSIVAFGLALAIYDPPLTAQVRPPTATEWFVITLAIGIVSGALVQLFLGDIDEDDRLFIGLAGAIVLVSGAATYLGLSPFLPALMLGATLANTSRARRRIGEMLGAIEPPLTFMVLVLAGALWRPVADWAILPVLLLLLLRIAGKVGGARLASRLAGSETALRADWGRALLGQGVVALGIGVNYLLLERSVLADLLFTTVVASVLLTDLLSARAAQQVVRRLTGGDAPVAPAPAGAPEP